MSNASAYPVVPRNKVSLPKNGKSVLIIGAGLSGLISACELLDRGFEVTVLEKNASAGGQLLDWRDKTFGGPSSEPGWKGLPLDLGTQLIPWFYRNLREFAGRHDISFRSRRVNAHGASYAFIQEGGVIDDKFVSRAPAPWHTLATYRDPRPGASSLVEALNLMKALAFLVFDSNNPEHVDYLDSMSVEELARTLGFSDMFVRATLRPVMGAFNFNSTSRSSALSWHRITTASFGHWRDLFHFQFFKDSKAETVIEPLKRYILEKGGRILFQSEVESIAAASGRIVEVTTRALTERDFSCRVCGWMRSGSPGRCSLCGHPVARAAERDIPAKTLSADYYLLAVDLPGARKIFSKEPFRSNPFFQPALRLPTAKVTCIYLWYPRVKGRGALRANWADYFGPREILFGAAAPFICPLANITAMRPNSYSEFDADAVGVQTALTDGLEDLSEREAADVLDRHLRSMIPGLPAYLDSRVFRTDTFATMEVRSERNRPSQQTPYRNLLLLGDWVAYDRNAIFMEKVAVVAKTAVNRLLDLAGQREGRIEIIRSETPNLAVSAARTILTGKGLLPPKAIRHVGAAIRNISDLTDGEFRLPL